MFNPASAKQILVESANRGGSKSMFEQGAGGITQNLEPAAKLLEKYKRRASFRPGTLHMAETPCHYHWPYCAQPLCKCTRNRFHSLISKDASDRLLVCSDVGAIPTVVNVTILNALGAHGYIARAPKWVGKANGQHLDLTFEASDVLWPWSGWLAVAIAVKPEAAAFEGIVEGTIEMAVGSEQGAGLPSLVSELSLPVTVRVILTPKRAQRLLWDIGHSMMYPSGARSSPLLACFFR